MIFENYKDKVCKQCGKSDCFFECMCITPHIHCIYCGYTTWIAPPEDQWGSDEPVSIWMVYGSFGYGAAYLVTKDGYSWFFTLREPTEEGSKFVFEGHILDIDSSIKNIDLDYDATYVTNWNADAEKVEVICGTIPPPSAIVQIGLADCHVPTWL